MKSLRGYISAAITIAVTLGLTRLAKSYSDLLDLFYPYVTRGLQNFLANATGAVGSVVWQAIVILLLLVLVASIGLMILFKWKFVRWLGGLLAACALIWSLHTCIYGLNYYASPLSEDLGMQEHTLTQEDVEKATLYFRDGANALALLQNRDENGALVFEDFDALSQKAGAGFEKLIKQKGGAVFAGSTAPVKKLGWSGLYTAMGICGFTMPLTGEAAVNPEIPSVSLPYVMCHEMSHRMCIARENDANFAAFLACRENGDVQYVYSAYYMAYRYCISALGVVDFDRAMEIRGQENNLLKQDLTAYDRFFEDNKNEVASQVADVANDTYIKVSGDESGTASYGQVASLLVAWHIETIENPAQEPEEEPFNPFDKDFINGLLGGNT